MLADEGVQNLFAAFGGQGLFGRLQEKSVKSIRHRQEEQANAQIYGTQYNLTNRKIEKLICEGK